MWDYVQVNFFPPVFSSIYMRILNDIHLLFISSFLYLVFLSFAEIFDTYRQIWWNYRHSSGKKCRPFSHSYIQSLLTLTRFNRITFPHFLNRNFANSKNLTRKRCLKCAAKYKQYKNVHKISQFSLCCFQWNFPHSPTFIFHNNNLNRRIR